MSSGISQEQVEEVLRIKRSADEAASIIIERLKDKTIPLDERWAVYEKFVAENLINDDDSCGDGEVDVLETIDGKPVEVYEHFYIQRYEKTHYVDMFDNMKHGIVSQILVPESIDRWREKVLATPSFASFTYDW